jgi:cytochrome bd ubiquinol oxidase subunit I
MDSLDLARWQFGITTVYHFLFVPLTIGLAPIVAVLQTAWYRTHDERWLRMTKFFGKLFLINFSMGIVTGLVQEFQFGMNWSEYSRFVGDVFGAPLAMEALLAFFLESTFLGLWIFGWDRLSPRVHLATIWLVALGVNASAYFILAANSFMQHPVGVRYNPETRRAELTSIIDVLTNSTNLTAFPHVLTASLMTGGTFVLGIAGWWTVKLVRAGRQDEAGVYRPALRVGIIVLVLGGVGVLATGDAQAKTLFDQQPMKMASAEALCGTEDGADFSLFAIGDLSNECDVRSIGIPKLTSFLATGDPDATVRGVNDLQKEYSGLFGPGDYRPLLVVTYWNFRLMMGFAVLSAALALAALWLTRKGRTPGSPWFSRLCLAALPAPFLANTAGWVFTEMGRQPWVVAPNLNGDTAVRMKSASGVSPIVNSPTVITSLVVFTLLYGILALVWFGLMRRYAAHGAPPAPADSGDDGDGDDKDEHLQFAY